MISTMNKRLVKNVLFLVSALAFLIGLIFAYLNFFRYHEPRYVHFKERYESCAGHQTDKQIYAVYKNDGVSNVKCN